MEESPTNNNNNNIKTRRRRRHDEDGSPSKDDDVDEEGTKTHHSHTQRPVPMASIASPKTSTTTLLPEYVLQHIPCDTQQKRKEALPFLISCIVFPVLIHVLRRHSDVPMPILIPYLMPEVLHADNIGGWKYGGRHKRYLPVAFNSEEDGNDWDDGMPDYGGLVFLSLSANNFQRHIRINDMALYHAEKEAAVDLMDQEYISKRHWFDDEIEDVKDEQVCRRPSWEKTHYPNCNGFHEIDLARPYDSVLAKRIGDLQDSDSVYLAHGWFRDVLALHQPQFNSSGVLKVARYTKHEMNYRAMYNARRDALIMERLSGSPNIVDIYGHCGASVLVESLPTEMESKIIPGSGYASKKGLNDSKDVDVKNQKYFSVPEKLDIALEMAESIAELHGFKDGVIIHDDIQLCQWLKNEQGQLKLGDFNRARVLAWNDEKQEYCKYNTGTGYGNYRSPEEFAKRDLIGAHDVFSYGNNIYALLTGLWVFYDNEDDEVVHGLLVNGTVAYVDDRYRTRSYIEGRLVEIMERCWTYDPEKRVSIFEVVDFLRETKKEYERRKKTG